MCLKLTIISFLNIASITATLTEGPVSVSALVGENALFHCTGTGITIVWRVDGSLATETNITDRGITPDVPVTSSGTVQSTLTVPATSVNNGTTVQCRVLSLSGSVTSNNATLTVLPGIGQVVNVRFTPSFSAVLWDPPSTAGVLSGLSYIVIVMNNNTGRVIVSATTTNTNYTLPDNAIQNCQYYTANVTAFSSEHHSDSVVTGQSTPGEIYTIRTNQDIDVIRTDNSSIKLSVHLNLEIPGLLLPCPGQRLKFLTYPRENGFPITNHSEVMISDEGDHVYPIIVTEGKLLCTAAINLIVNDAVTEVLSQNFSTFDVQDCDVSTDHTSILVECTFAINSIAPGIVVIQDDQNIDNTTLVHNGDKGSVNITGLPAGEYSVRVYDNMEDIQENSSAAYQHSTLLHIVPLLPSPTPSSSAVAADTTISVTDPVFSTIPPSIAISTTSPDLIVDPTPVILGAITTVIILVIIVLVVPSTVCLLLLKSYKRKSNSLAPDSVETVVWKEKENIYTVPDIEPKDTAVNIIRVQSGISSVPDHESTYMEARGDYLLQQSTTPPTTQPTVGAWNVKPLDKQSTHSPATENTVTTSVKTTPSAKQKETVYADLQHSTNPPIPALSVGQVQYATVQSQTDKTKSKVTGEPVYADLHLSTNQPAAPLPAELVPVHYTVTSPQGNKLSVSTMSNNNSHVETKVSYYPETTSLSTSTKTSDYHSTQSTGSTEAEPQKSAELSESKTEASSTKLSGYYSDQSDPAETTAQYQTGGDGSFYEVPKDCTENGSNAWIATTPTSGPAAKIDDTRCGEHGYDRKDSIIVPKMSLQYTHGAAPTVRSQAETGSDTATNSSASNKSNTQYHQCLTCNTGCGPLPNFSANWTSTDYSDQSYTSDQCERSSSAVYSASEPIDGNSVSTESTGPDKAVFSQLTIASPDMEDSSDPSAYLSSEDDTTNSIFYISEEVLSEEETSLPASEQTAPWMRFCLGMEHYTLLKLDLFLGRLLLSMFYTSIKLYDASSETTPSVLYMIGAANIMSDTESLFSRLTETLSSISSIVLPNKPSTLVPEPGYTSFGGEHKLSALPESNCLLSDTSFVDQLKNFVGCQLLQLVC